MDDNSINQQSELAMSRNASSLSDSVDKYWDWNLSVFPIQKDKAILDLGCGPGLYFKELMKYSPSHYVGTDYSSLYIDQMKELFSGYSNCSALQLDLLAPEIPKEIKKSKFDYLLCFDVLEHIENHEDALNNIYKIMDETGSKFLFLRVPALQFIYGKNDEAIGHYRRYTKKNLKALLKSCSFNIDVIRYQNFIGILPWYIIGNVLKRSLAISSNEGSLFNLFVPALKFIERIIPPPIGLSLYCVCTKK